MTSPLVTSPLFRSSQLGYCLENFWKAQYFVESTLEKQVLRVFVIMCWWFAILAM